MSWIIPCNAKTTGYVGFDPNITGSFNAQQNNSDLFWGVETTGAFVDDHPFPGKVNFSEGAQGYGYSFDASRLNPIYGTTSSVQPSALLVLACIKF